MPSHKQCAMRMHAGTYSEEITGCCCADFRKLRSFREPQTTSNYRMFLTNYNERRSIIYHVIFMILFYLLRAIRAFIRACAVAPEQIGRKDTKKIRHSQGKCRKNVKIFSNFLEKRGLAGEYDVYSEVFEVCYPHICPIMRVRSIKRIAA